jgi:uncharacterized protein (DUF305 family)
MAFSIRLLLPALLLAPAAFAQTKNAPAPIVQPGPPGESGKTLSAKSVRGAARKPQPDDIAFMQGMIHHHAQAVEMVALLRTRGESKALQAFGERISISQTDEIKFMKQWLEDRGQSSSMQHDHMNMANMQGMNHDMSKMKGGDQLDSMAGLPPMPGMLTAEQMKALAAAQGAAFDYLFLTGMIQHHTGALTMVDDLYANPAAAQDPALFDFVTDIVNTQTAEIKIMQKMLDEEKK